MKRYKASQQQEIDKTMTSTIDYIPSPGKFKDLHGTKVSAFNMTENEKGMLMTEKDKNMTLEDRLRDVLEDKYDTNSSTREVLLTKLMFGRDLKYAESTEELITKLVGKI